VQPDDRLLVERARTDPEAFGELYDRHARAVYRLALSILHNPAQAEDVTAEVFVKALRAIGRYRDQGRPFTCWLYQIARNTVANQFRVRPTLPIGEEMRDGRVSLEDEAIRGEELRHVWRLVDRLPPAQRTAMILKFREDLSLRTVAVMMGRSEPAVKQLIFRAVQRLRPELGAVPGGATGQLAHAMS
jgi:RNA polymerase sigma-70 factor (ECF subfamily)